MRAVWAAGFFRAHGVPVYKAFGCCAASFVLVTPL
jgi:hypothetical protein